MDWSTSDVADVVKVISYLLPGFLAAWVFYGLTAHPRRSPFERVVQSLIFTAIVQGLTAIAGWFHHYLSAYYVLWFEWSKDVAFVASLANAIILGLAFAICANQDLCHSLLRCCYITKRTSFPSEWFSAFYKKKCFITLHLTGSRRVYGWPVEWPDQPDSGHFALAQAAWVLDNNEMAPLHLVDTLLIPATSVEMVEMMKFPGEVEATADEIRLIEETLVALQAPKENEDGKQSTTAPAEVTTNGTTECVRQAASSRIEAGHVAPTPSQKAVNTNHKPKKGRR